MKFPRRNYLRKAIVVLVFIFFVMNVVAFMHAWKFTHFSETDHNRTADPKELTLLNKIKILFTGIDNPKPQHQLMPDRNYSVISFNRSGMQGWHFKIKNPKGTVILFHGYAGEKSMLLRRGYYFNSIGYNILLVDFPGSGDSKGNSTSIGFHEADQVFECYNFILAKEEKNIFLFGTSMGAAAILKSINDYHFSPTGILLECPFGSLYDTVCARFHNMNLPCFPMAALLTFWGGIQQGYWAFGHNPSQYATTVACPTLIMFGEMDDRVTRNETNEIFSGLTGFKVLKTYPKYGHNIFTPENDRTWKNDVSTFLDVVEVR
jgi:alpha-beta hydrolase superfamily lysophospholipase